ncbi:MAG TPA: c-type cytochrome [Afifellaceae bacterium]|nr:c-type cytochrome [Afifellaceae bacterium]
MKTWTGILLAGLAALAAGALLFAWSGLYNVSASAGHWPVTTWFLRFTLENSIETHSLGITAPPLDDAGLVLKGAGHFETGCAPCHGMPGRPRGPIVLGLTPQPPDLTHKIEEWSDRELFWIVRNGLKYTAMPPWPAPERQDEVWAMVAFLRQLPQLDAAEYRDLAYGPARDDPEAASGARMNLAEIVQAIGPIIHECARCHGWDGAGRGEGAFPKLAIQNPDYLAAQLRAYASGARRSGVMQPIAAALTERQMADLARHFAEAEADAAPRVRSPDGAEPAPSPDAAAGAEIAETGIPEQGVPACLVCHGETEPRNRLFPHLAGQYADYLELQLRLFAEGSRGGTPFADIMRMVASRLNEEQRRQVAAYFASLPEPRTGEGADSAARAEEN